MKNFLSSAEPVLSQISEKVSREGRKGEKSNARMGPCKGIAELDEIYERACERVIEPRKSGGQAEVKNV